MIKVLYFYKRVHWNYITTELGLIMTIWGTQWANRWL